jgi:hypothetical protein
MARPRMNPDLRFPDVVRVFDAAMSAPKPFRIKFSERSKAVQFMHKMNRYRKAVRDLHDENVTVYDCWEFRVRENYVEIVDKPYITPFNARFEAAGRDITKELQDKWLPLNPLGIPIQRDSSMYAIEYKRQFGVDPPSDIEPTKQPPPIEDKENNIDPDKPLGLFEEDEGNE